MLLPVTVSFLAGLTLGAFVPFLPLTILLALVLLAMALARLQWRGALTARHSVVLYGALLAGAVYAVLIGPPPGSDPPRSSDGTVQFTGLVIQPVQHGPHRSVFILRPDELTLNGHAIETVRVTWRFPDRDVVRGDRVAIRARLHEPSGAVNPGGFDYGAHLRRLGIEAVASITGPGAIRLVEVHVPLRWRLWRMIDQWRDRIRQAAVTTLTEPSLGVYLGIITGEPGYLTPAVRDAFMATGTVHILSISGSHLGLIAVLSFWLIKGVCRILPSRILLALSRRITPTRLAALLTLGPVAFYTLLAGAEVATVRSCIMIVLFLLTVWLGREQYLIHALAIAALLIVLHDPAALFAISFQLSFLSVLTIALVLKRRLDAERSSEGLAPRQWTHWVSDYLWMTTGITLVTTPLVAYYFNQIAWLGLLANLVVVPFAGFVLVPLGLVSAVATLLTGSPVLLAGDVNQRLLDLFCTVTFGLARIPGAEWHVASPSIAAIAAYYALLLVAWRSGHRRTAAWSATAAACLLCWWIWSPRALAPAHLQVTFLDVGQGDAAVIEMPSGETILIDGGSVYDTLDLGRSVVAPFLWDRGIRHIDHVIATHPQLDHVGGLATILEKFEVGQYWDNGVARQEAFYRTLESAVATRPVVRHTARAGAIVATGGGCRLLVLNPPIQPTAIRAGAIASGTMLNNLSVVTRLDCDTMSFLFSADIEVDGIRHLPHPAAWRPVNVLKVPHHGARSSLDSDWLERLAPVVSVISVGRYNPYGHPAAAVLQTCRARSVQCLRTDEHGAIWFDVPPGRSVPEAHRSRDGLLQPVALVRPLWPQERLNVRKLASAWLGRVWFSLQARGFY